VSVRRLRAVVGLPRTRGTRLFAGLLVAFVVVGSCGSFWLWRTAVSNYSTSNAAADLRADQGQLANVSDEIAAAGSTTAGQLSEVSELQSRIERELAVIGDSGLDSGHWMAMDQRVRSSLDTASQLRSYALSGQTQAAADLGRANDAESNLLERELGAEMDELRVAADQEATLAQAGLLGVNVLIVAGVVVGLLWDGRRRQRAERYAAELRNRERFEAMVEQGSDLSLLTDRDGSQLYVSPAVDHVLGYPPGSLVASRIPDLIHADDVLAVGLMLNRARDAGRAGPVDLRILHADGSWRTIDAIVVDMTSVPAVGGMLWTARDVTDRRSLESKLERQALSDPLTGVANRALFMDHLELAAVRAGQGRPFAVLLADLDGFKWINDALGHHAGDAVLVEIAARMESCARRSDTIARLGGDEFALLLDDAGPADAATMADRILDVLRQPVRIAGTDLHVGISIGIACPESDTGGHALADADIAMCEAKLRGRGRYVLFEPEMHTRAQEQLSLASDLAEAINRGQLEVYYQPTVSLSDRSISGAEALLRWWHPDRGLVSPETFIPIAERNGQILALGRWVLQRACEQARDWALRFPMAPARTMSVNLSGRQIADRSLVNDVKEILSKTGVDPRTIILEITESVLMDDLDTIPRLHQLKDLGLRLAIDDFGTGHSSLAYLRQFPIDILKIDRSFVSAAGKDAPGGQALVRMMIDLAASLDLQTVAEGIENESEATWLRATGCTTGQGFVFSPALPADQFAELLVQGRAVPWNAGPLLATTQHPGDVAVPT
jgi:diguanylate cyclase (GGDEF)-like protein/PAS domain S-box-containing protein